MCTAPLLARLMWLLLVAMTAFCSEVQVQHLVHQDKVFGAFGAALWQWVTACCH